MSATYDPSLPTPKDHIRFALGDTDTTSPLVEDETIQAKLQAFGYTEALAQLAEGLASAYAQMPDSFSDDGTQFSWRDRVATWRALAKSARESVAPPATSPPRARLITIGQTTVQATTSTGIMGGFRSE